MIPKFKRTSVRTFSGLEVELLDADPATIDIVDIAHHLSKLDRYNGAGAFHYSVGQHSLLVAEFLPPKYKLWGLLHDATEAYLGDVVAPLKGLLPTYDGITNPLMKEIEFRIAQFPESVLALNRLKEEIALLRDTFLGYRDIEQNLMTCISDKFLLGMPRPAVVKEADTAVMVAEMYQAMNWPDLAAQQGVPPAPVRIHQRTWQEVRAEFLRKYEEYGGR